MGDLQTADFWREAARLRAQAQSPLTRGLAKRRLGHLCKASAGTDLFVETTIARLPVRLNLREPADREIYLFGRGDPRGLGAIEAVMARLDCRTAWDVGVNRGNHSSFMRLHCRRLFGFEPNPAEFQRASSLMASEANVTLLNIGLSDQEGELPFMIDEQDSGGSTFAVDREKANFVAEVRTGDSVAAQYGLTDIDFIKVDVEGYEKNVLRGLSGVIATSRPVIVVEILQQQNTDTDNIVGFLPGYAAFGNRMNLASTLYSKPYTFCRFEIGKTYMCAMLVPIEKLDRLAPLLPR
jgi:FkbM family methyltransferase